MSAGYEALATKAKAMYGKRMRKADLVRIINYRTLDDILSDLRQQGSWAPAVAALPEGALFTRARLEDALRDQLRREGVRLSAFVPQQDRALMEFPLLRAEMEHILAALRRLRANLSKETEKLPRDYLTHTKVDLEGLHRCTDMNGLLEAIRNSIYYDALSHLSGEGEVPTYGVAEALLTSTYYRHMQRLIRRRYDGDVRRVLERSLGDQVDMLNIMHVLRMKQYFPQTDDYLPVLLPYHYRVRPEQIHAMCAAPSAEAVLEMVESTPYASVFRGADIEDLNNLYSAALYKFSRRQLLMGKPSIYSAVGYLNLRELELKAVVSAVEASKYRQPLDPSFFDILGE